LFGRPQTFSLTQLTANDSSVPPWVSGEFDVAQIHRGATKILNRGQFIDDVDRQLQITRKSIDPRFTVLLVSVDNYPSIVTERGKTAADMLIRAVVEPIGAMLTPRDAVAIFPNGIIGVLLETALLRVQASDFAAEMVGGMKTAAVACSIIDPTACVGIARVTGNYVSAEDIVRDAGIALHAAQAEGRDKTVIFHRALEEAVVETPIAI
jgi:diguanylate cyclase (GGDEF)-like protein